MKSELVSLAVAKDGTNGVPTSDFKGDDLEIFDFLNDSWRFLDLGPF